MSKEKMVRDTTIKILSVIFAALLWFYVITEQNPVVPKDITIPVRITNLDVLNKSSLMVLEDPSAYFITLKLKGKKEILDAVNQNTLNAYADISNYLSIGEKTVPVIVNGIPDGVSITSRSDQSIKVSLDKKLVVQKPVAFNITGNPIGGLAHLEPVLTPSEVVLTGAESIINRVQTVKVDVDIAGVNTSVNKKLPVRLLDEDGQDIYGIQLDTQWVNVNVPISNTKRVPIQLVLEGNPAEGFIIFDKLVEPREILVTGDQKSLDSLTSINTTKQTINNLAEDMNIAVTLDLPEGIHLVNANEQITAIIKVQKVVTNTVDISAIEYRNLSQGYIVEDAPARSIRLTVRGPEEMVKDIEKHIALYVDLANAKVGTGSYEVMVNKSSMLEILEGASQHIGLDIKSRE